MPDPRPTPETEPKPGRDAESSADEPAWPNLPIDTLLTVVKLAPNGEEAARYPGRVIGVATPAPWMAIGCSWVLPRVEMDGLVIEPGDHLEEYFSPIHPFNVFAAFAPDGPFRGWYANVTQPATLDLAADPAVLTWHDLYLDVVLLESGRLAIRDDDELAAAKLADRDPALLARILAARESLLIHAIHRVAPFRSRGQRLAPAGRRSTAGGPTRRTAETNKSTISVDK